MASTLAAYSIPPINYIGTVLFIAYIVAALELTNHLTTHIFALYESRSKPSVPTSQRPPPAYILLFASLAALSFAVLSYHMVSFLAQEYSAWCAANGLARGMAPRDLMPKLWAWMTDSTLFATFARELVGGGRESRGGREWAWTGMAVAGWMALGQWMGKHGQGQRRAVPHLWAYFVLGQILPVSFVQNLFFITLLCLPKPDPKKEEKKASEDRATSSLTSTLTDFGLGGVFVITLASLPSFQDSPLFMQLVLVIRLLLFAPYVLQRGNISGSKKASFDPVWMWMGAVVWLAILKLVVQDGKSGTDVFAAARSSPAVRALVDDMLLGVVSAGLWIGLGLHQSY